MMISQGKMESSDSNSKRSKPLESKQVKESQAAARVETKASVESAFAQLKAEGSESAGLTDAECFSGADG